MVWMWAAIATLGLAVVILGLKIAALRHGVRILRKEMAERSEQDTNALLTLPCRDRELRKLASCLNEELKKLRYLQLQYQQGDRELKDAVTNISHDLRTPLTAIAGYLELLKGQPLSPDTQRYVQQIQSRTDAMKRLTEELFRYSVVVSEPLELHPVNLGRAVEEVLLSFYGAFEQRKMEPKVTLPEQPVIRTLDSSGLNRILGNILSNALKYSAGDLNVSLDCSGTITFQNAAPGLDQVTAGRLFHRFYTVESGSLSTGLGLSIAQDLTQRMGGKIGAAFHGENLTIWVSFPQSQREELPQVFLFRNE